MLPGENAFAEAPTIGDGVTSSAPEVRQMTPIIGGGEGASVPSTEGGVEISGVTLEGDEEVGTADVGGGEQPNPGKIISEVSEALGDVADAVQEVVDVDGGDDDFGDGCGDGCECDCGDGCSIA